MDLEQEKLIKAREILLKIANGINPLTGEEVEPDNFVADPRLSRCFFYVAGELQKTWEQKKGRKSSTLTKFMITPEEKNRVILPADKIGVNQFARCINTVIDLNRSKKLTGMELNKQLKKMGILGEKEIEGDRKRTIITDKSKDYGIESEQRNYDGTEYEKIVFNDLGKKFLLDNLENILAYEE